MTDFRNTTRGLIAGLALAAIALPSIAFAASRDSAQAAIAAAQSKIDTGDRLGTTGSAADVQVRARVSLKTAQEQLKRHHDGQAFRDASEASALADLAMATAEYTALTVRRDKLGAR